MTERLEAAEHEIVRLHRWRRDRRAVLMNEIVLGRRSLAWIDQRRKQLDHESELRSRKPAVFRGRDALAPSKQPEAPRRQPIQVVEHAHRGLEL